MEIADLLQTLRGERNVWATAACDHSYPLASSTLFHAGELPLAAEAFRSGQIAELKALDAQVRAFARKLTDGFTEKSVYVKMGKTVEKIVPALPGFPFAPGDCRAVFDPIDYVVFSGLRRNQVERVEFVDVKTGAADLSRVQREIRDAVQDGRVGMRGLP